MDVIYTDLAQRINSTLIAKLQESEGSSELSVHLDEVLSSLVRGLCSDRGSLWQIIGDRLTVTNNYSSHADSTNMLGVGFDSQTGTKLVLNFLAHGYGAIDFDNSDVDWEPLLKLSEEYSSHLVVPLRARTIFCRFVVLQTIKERQWSATDYASLEKVGALLSVLISYVFDLKRLASV